jgi:hypothetical protein
MKKETMMNWVASVDEMAATWSQERLELEMNQPKTFDPEIVDDLIDTILDYCIENAETRSLSRPHSWELMKLMGVPQHMIDELD